MSNKVGYEKSGHISHRLTNHFRCPAGFTSEKL